MKNYFGNEEEKYYITEEAQYRRIYEIISNMPNFVLSESYDTTYRDVFYDTKDKFLEINRASCRVRLLGNADLLSIKYISSNPYTEAKEREGYLDLPKNTDIANNKQALMFLSTKLNDVYSSRIDMDIMRKLRDVKPYLVIDTKRTVHILKNNEDLQIAIKFDRLTYQSKFLSQNDLVVKIELLNYPDSVNLDTYNRFIKELRKKAILIPDNESKFEAGKRIFNLDRFNKKPKKEEENEEEKKKDNKK